MYALAASAAGVGVLALVQPAQAEIVYTPTHQKLRSINKDFFLDLNHDGVNDFKFYVYVFSTSAGENCIGEVNLSRLGSGNEYSTVAFASALKAGGPVGKTRYFPNHTREVMGWGVGRQSATIYGPWTKSGQPVDHRYLGLKFDIKGKTHYGWARLNVEIYVCRASATLTGYAYETVANKPIIAGKTKGPDVITVQPASLGHLAAGASAIRAWRSRK